MSVASLASRAPSDGTSLLIRVDGSSYSNLKQSAPYQNDTSLSQIFTFLTYRYMNVQSTSSTGHSYSSTSAYILVSDQPVPRPPYQLSQLHGKGISSAEMPTLNHSHHLKFSPASLSEHCPSCRLAKTISHAYRESTTRMALAGVRTVHATALLHLEPSSKPVGKPQPKRRNSFPHSYAVACRKEGTRHTPNAALTPKLCTLAKSYTTLRLAGQCA